MVQDQRKWQLDWVRRMDHVTVLYGGAALPETAGEFLRRAGRAVRCVPEATGVPLAKVGARAIAGWLA